MWWLSSISWLCFTSSLLSAGRAAADWGSSMGEGVRLGVEHPHHWRGHRSGCLPAAHRHRRPHRGDAPPSSHALLCILPHVGTEGSWDDFHISCSEVWLDGYSGLNLCVCLFPCFSLLFLWPLAPSTWSFFLLFSCSNLEFPVPVWRWTAVSRWAVLVCLLILTRTNTNLCLHK